MKVKVFDSKDALGRAAAVQAGSALRRAIAESGRARVIAATGASQFEFLKSLTEMTDIDWKAVELFHLDEYIGLPISHPASFRAYLLERLISKTGIERYHLLDGEDEPGEAIRDAAEAVRAAPVDIAFVGIGENGHLAFNDPPADFDTDEPFIIVDLDEACRGQQVGEGWFADLSEVPKQAISMSVRQILKTREIICIAPDKRKAEAVKSCFWGEISPLFPASILRTHSDVTLYLDEQSASLLDPQVLTHELR